MPLNEVSKLSDPTSIVYGRARIDLDLRRRNCIITLKYIYRILHEEPTQASSIASSTPC